MKFKRFISCALVLSMLTSALPLASVPASAADITLTPSNTSGTLTITLKIKGTPDAPAAPTKSEATKTSITLAAVDGCEYSKDGTTWQESPVFSGLTPGTEYTFYQRKKETDDNNASPASEDTKISTLADTYDLVITLVIKDKAKFTTEPAAKENLMYSGTAVELVTAGTVEGGTAMYSLDGTNYSENIPMADSAGTYTVYYYAKGDADHKDGDVNTLPVSVGIQGTLTITLVIKQKYSVTFDVDGGAPAPDAQTVVDGEKATAPATDPTKEGYTFGGWYNGETEFDFETAITADTELKAKWIANLAVTYDGNGADSGTAPTDSQKYEPNANVTVLGNTGNLKKTGYTFNGWNTKADGTGTSYAAGGTFAITADTTLYAQWTINQYTITFDADGGSKIAAITQDYGTAVTKPADPTKTGYTFDGWDKEIPATMPAEDITIKAKWTINQYTITFDTAGGSKIDAITQDYGTAVTAPADPTRAGLVFAGWEPNLPATMPAYDMTVRAHWNVAEIPHVTINSTTTTTTTTTTPTPAAQTETMVFEGEETISHTDLLSWTGISGATSYLISVEVNNKYVPLAATTKTNIDVVHASNGKYYVSEGGDYTEYTYKSGKFVKGGTITAAKADSLVKANNVTDNYMLQYTRNGQLSSEKTALKTSVTVYYKPDVTITTGVDSKTGKSYIRLKWAKVPGATSYKVCRYVNGKLKTVSELDADRLSVKITGTKSGKTYTYAVKAFVDGKWTKVYASDLASIKSK